MKKHIIYLFVLCFSFSFSQKKNNGKLYIEHPAMDVVEQFNEAFVSGDLETMKSLVSDDFRWYTLSMREPGTLQQLLNRSNYLSKNVVNFDIKHYGGAYPDALEYKKDDIDLYNRMYAETKDSNKIKEFRTKVVQAEKDHIRYIDNFKYSLFMFGTVWALNITHALIVDLDNNVSNGPDIDIVYNEFTSQPQLRFSIALD